jgi:hypothetical protein
MANKRPARIFFVRLCGILTTVLLAEAFQHPIEWSRRNYSPPFRRLQRDIDDRRRQRHRHFCGLSLLRSKDENARMLDGVPSVDELEEGTADVTEEELLEMVAANQPNQFTVVKELLGLNVFTLILALLIAFFMGANFFLGPGWLGQKLGIEGTGTFQDVSDAIPGVIDLSQPDYLL